MQRRAVPEMGWGLLIPKGWTAVGTAAAISAASLHFTDTITLGSILTAAIVVILSGLFTLRNNLKSFWRGLAEERKAQVEVLEKRLIEKDESIVSLQADAVAKMEAVMEEQRAIRHDLKDQLATVTRQFEVERAKTDLSVLSKVMSEQHDEAMIVIRKGLEIQTKILAVFEQRETGE